MPAKPAPGDRPATGGRKTKLTDELIAQFEAALQGHNTVQAVCDMLNISRQTFYRWIQEGEAAKGGLKRDFSDTVKRAQGMSQVMLVNKIANDPSWQAKAWLLERLHPQQYGRRQLIAHAGPDGETPLAAGNGSKVALHITLQTPDGGVTPWTFAPDDQDDGTERDDQWGKDIADWDSPHPPPLKASEIVEAIKNPGPTGPPARGPSFPKPAQPGKPALDTGGRPRDPDA